MMGNVFRRSFLAFLNVFMLLALLGAGCDFPVSIEIKELNRLIDVLNQWPDQWEETITNSIQALDAMGTDLSQKIAKDLRSVLANAKDQVLCTEKYTGDYIRTEAMRIRHENAPLFYPNAPIYTPWVCTVEPVDPITEKTTYVSFRGYFFRQYQNINQGKIRAFLAYEVGMQIIADNLPFDTPTDYALTVKLGDTAWWKSLNIDRTKTAKLYLRTDVETLSDKLIEIGEFPPEKVTIYAGGNFDGASQTLNAGYYNSANITIGNDSLSSVQVPAGYAVALFKDSNWKGDSLILYADTNNFTLGAFDNETSSVYVFRTDIPNALIFYDSDYRGTMQSLTVGAYNTPDLVIGNDNLSSIKVPAGLTVTLYQNENWSGTAVVITGPADVPNLGQNGYSFNDKTSSIKVESN